MRRRLFILAMLACVLIATAVLRNVGVARAPHSAPAHAPKMSTNSAFISAAKKGRRVYPYSVIPGGVYSKAEWLQAIGSDRVTRAHYALFDPSALRMTKADHVRWLYASFRVDNAIFWTRRRIRIADGEALVTDGRHLARARCGNRLAELPQGPLAQETPEEEAWEMAVAEDAVEDSSEHETVKSADRGKLPVGLLSPGDSLFDLTPQIPVLPSAEMPPSIAALPAGWSFGPQGLSASPLGFALRGKTPVGAPAPPASNLPKPPAGNTTTEVSVDLVQISPRGANSNVFSSSTADEMEISGGHSETQPAPAGAQLLPFEAPTLQPPVISVSNPNGPSVPLHWPPPTTSQPPTAAPPPVQTPEPRAEWLLVALALSGAVWRALRD